jgi:nitroreductase
LTLISEDKNVSRTRSKPQKYPQVPGQADPVRESRFNRRTGLLENLSRSKPHGSSFLKNAALGIVVCGNPQINDVWIEDASIASIFIHLAAAALDLGSCWIQIRERNHNDSQTAEAYIARVLNLPPHIKVESIIAIGYPDESKSAHPRETLPYEKVSLNHYGKPYSEGP